MLKTLDILIGGVTVLLVFSMAVTVITQAVNSLLNRKGKYLKAGLATLLQQLGIPQKDYALEIAEEVLKSPLIANVRGGLGEVIHREEFTKLVLDLASGQGSTTLSSDALKALQSALQANGISDPAKTLQNVRSMALQLEASNPELANHERDALAILHEGASDFVARIDSWFDQTITRVADRFTAHTHLVTLGIAVVVVVAVQLDIIAVLNRLSIDDQIRNSIVSNAASQVSNSAAGGQVDAKQYYGLLSTAGLITLPVDNNWVGQLKDWRKLPGMALSILLISLGAPFWYNVLKDLLKLRSSMAQNDDQQRTQRQTAQPATSDAATSGGTSAGAVPAPAWLSGERGDLTAVG